MEIKIDTDKDSVESIQQVQRILKTKTQEEKSVKKPRKQAKKANITDAESFLTSKYRFFIVRAISRLGHRDILGTEEYMTSTPDVRRELRKDVREELIFDQSTLFREFVNYVKNFNFPSIDPYIFQNALKDIVDRPLYEPECMYIERIKLGQKNLLRVIF